MGASVAEDIFNEVDEDLRAERLRAQARRFAVVGIVLVVVAGIAVGGWQWHQHQRAEALLAAGAGYFAAQKDADVAPPAAAGPDAPLTPEQQRAVGAFGGLAANSPESVRSLSRLRLAALDWSNKQPARALATWDALSHDAAADPAFRQLADLLWVEHQPPGADGALLKTRLRDALSPSSPWHYLATEADAMIDLQTGHVEDARRKLQLLSQDPAVPEGLHARAAGVLETLPPVPAAPAASAKATSPGAAAVGTPATPAPVAPQTPAPKTPAPKSGG
ncbi:hypothetical protein [Rhizosaccharibacter radicis]|uniref:Tetratricopeptide repeat-like domain-containing protein n=1 Tax=Rhizosaccharibacter radicis TaxID=2782605 RepID=A0ABT1VYA0_9PROT|nr:hypothetical protein [Acetobacteraceae bacterium KSS12]